MCFGKIPRITRAAFLNGGPRVSASSPLGRILCGASICSNCRCLLRGCCVCGSFVVSLHSAREMCNWNYHILRVTLHTKNDSWCKISLL